MQKKTQQYNLKHLALVACLFASAEANPAHSQAKPTPLHPAAVAVVEIQRPREGNLLHLRGIAGRGKVTFRMADACSTMPVRFVAGDFAGRRSDVGRTNSIRIVIRAPQAVERLFQGRDLVSDMFQISDDPKASAAEVQLVHGLSAETGFVINPGRSVAADLFRAQANPLPCPEYMRQYE